MRCQFEKCKHKTNTITGHCKYCDKDFCGNHNMMELHSCEKLPEYIASHKEKFKESVMKQKCIADKIAQI
jgi:predicted nucleic acid binding AN1-type Zn finger protein